MKKLSLLLFAIFTAVILNSCSKDEASKNDTNQIDEPLEIKENVLVKKITRTDAQGFVQTLDFKYDGNKIINIESEEEKISFFYSGNLIYKKEVYDKIDSYKETSNYTYYNDKKIKTIDEISFGPGFNGGLIFNSPNSTNPEATEMTKYRGLVYINQNKISEYTTIFENYDLLKDKIRPLLIDQNTYKYTYDENKNPFDNIIGMGYLLNNNTEFGKITPLLNATCKNNITKVVTESWLTYWGNPTSITNQQDGYIYERVFIYNELNYPTEINETVSINRKGLIEIEKQNIVYKFYY